MRREAVEVAAKNGANNVDLSKDDRIKREKSRLRGIFKDLDKNKLKSVEKLIETAAFMAISLRELEDVINAEGYIDEYQNGKDQYGTKERPEVKIHLAMTKNFTAIIKQLADLAPPERKKKSRLQALLDE